MSYRILVVDDSKLARMSVGKLLGALRPDWIRLEASNAEDAMLAAADADIALLDFNMPGKDGLAFAADLSKLKPGIPVAIVSANTQNEIVNGAHALGAEFLPKPLTAESLGKFLSDAVGRMKAETR